MSKFGEAHDSPPSALDLEALSLEEKSIGKAQRESLSPFLSPKDGLQFKALEGIVCHGKLPW